jgi:hypothetical protein
LEKKLENQLTELDPARNLEQDVETKLDTLESRR